MGDKKVYEVETDEEFFNRFKELEVKIRGIASMFQNEGMEVSEEQLYEYSDDVLGFKKAFDLLIENGNDRIKIKE